MTTRDEDLKGTESATVSNRSLERRMDILRAFASAQRVPMKLASLGRAYLSPLPAPESAAKIEQFRNSDIAG